MFVSLTTICHISPLCHSLIATLQLGLLDWHNSTRKCWNKLVLLIMRFVLSSVEVLKISTLFRQDQDQDQDFYFKTKIRTIFHVLAAPRDQDQGLKTTSPGISRNCRTVRPVFDAMSGITRMRGSAIRSVRSQW